jgi:hypothetical protein
MEKMGFPSQEKPQIKERGSGNIIKAALKKVMPVLFAAASIGGVATEAKAEIKEGNRIENSQGTLEAKFDDSVANEQKLKIEQMRENLKDSKYQELLTPIEDVNDKALEIMDSLISGTYKDFTEFDAAVRANSLLDELLYLGKQMSLIKEANFIEGRLFSLDVLSATIEKYGGKHTDLERDLKIAKEQFYATREDTTVSDIEVGVWQLLMEYTQNDFHKDFNSFIRSRTDILMRVLTMALEDINEMKNSLAVINEQHRDGVIEKLWNDYQEKK